MSINIIVDSFLSVDCFSLRCCFLSFLCVIVLLMMMMTSAGVDVFAGVQSVSVDVSKEEVLVESVLTSAEVQALIESTGRRAVLKGIGGSEKGEKPQT